MLIGNNEFFEPNCVLKKGETEWLRVDPPEDDNGPVRLSAKFFNTNGELDLHIDNNEWLASTSVWDLKVQGGSIEVFGEHRRRTIHLERVSDNSFRLTRLFMQFFDWSVEVNNKGDLVLQEGDTKVSLETSQAFGSSAVIMLP